MKKLHSFGELEFFANRPYEENIQSSTFTTIYKISRKSFIEILKEHPDQYVSKFYLFIFN